MGLPATNQQTNSKQIYTQPNIQPQIVESNRKQTHIQNIVANIPFVFWLGFWLSLYLNLNLLFISFYFVYFSRFFVIFGFPGPFPFSGLGNPRLISHLNLDLFFVCFIYFFLLIFIFLFRFDDCLFVVFILNVCVDRFWLVVLFPGSWFDYRFVVILFLKYFWGKQLFLFKESS